MKNIEIFIPSWPDNRDLVAKLGTYDHGHSCCDVDSFRVAFRARQSANGYTPGYHYRCWMDIGMTIFVHKDGQVQIELKAQDVRSADISQLEHLVKCLKWLGKRRDLVSGTGLKLESLPFYLMNLCTVLGIKRTVQYHGAGVMETYAPVSSALELIVAEAKRRWERLQ